MKLKLLLAAVVIAFIVVAYYWYKATVKKTPIKPWSVIDTIESEIGITPLH